MIGNIKLEKTYKWQIKLHCARINKNLRKLVHNNALNSFFEDESNAKQGIIAMSSSQNCWSLKIKKEFKALMSSIYICIFIWSKIEKYCKIHIFVWLKCNGLLVYTVLWQGFKLAVHSRVKRKRVYRVVCHLFMAYDNEGREIR